MAILLSPGCAFIKKYCFIIQIISPLTDFVHTVAGHKQLWIFREIKYEMRIFVTIIFFVCWMFLEGLRKHVYCRLKTSDIPEIKYFSAFISIPIILELEVDFFNLLNLYVTQSTFFRILENTRAM